MDQVSRPVLIILIAVVGLAGAWFTVLRPKSETSTPAPAPAAASAVQAPAPVKPAAPAKTPAQPRSTTTPAAPVADPSRPILRDLAAGKTAVLLFWNPLGEDDRAALDAVGKADRRGGKVTVRIANINDVADYAAITQGVEVLQAPTALVIGPDRKARTIVGYTEPREIDQLVGDVRAGR